VSIPAGAFVTVTLSGQVTGVQTTSDVAEGVAGELSQADLIVRSCTVDSPNVLWALLSAQWYHYRYDATVVVQTTKAYAQLDDVRAIVVGAFYDQVGSYPTGSAVALAGGDVSPIAQTSMLDQLASAAAAPAAALNNDLKLLIVGAAIVASIAVAVVLSRR
jgi:hypothetical protein